MVSYGLGAMWWRISVPILLLIVLTPWLSDWDIACERLFYTESSIPDQRFVGHGFFHFMYNWGPTPALAVMWTSLGLLIVSYLCSCWKGIRRPCWLLMLTLAVGGGLVVHALL